MENQVLCRYFWEESGSVCPGVHQPLPDLLTSFISLYNTTMKVIYIGCAYATVYLIYMKFKATYDGNHDTFRVEFLVVPVGGLAFLILWTFSIYLESVAILPQLFMISKTGEAETITTHYLFFLGLYRALYLINWIWRFYFEGFFDMIAIVAGVVQTILYCDFFYLYVTKDGQRGGYEGGRVVVDTPDTPPPTHNHHHRFLLFLLLFPSCQCKMPETESGWAAGCTFSRVSGSELLQRLVHGLRISV
ncbi:hypothetical protein F7725_021364 [Dissostichus mawsoni]|uniref:ER lumen protein-retaining receptor n=1 Tax=Dissostichus mawsoni TaxID=36200 RepID=A0A7J5ZAZ7_DISMA|nr:hypothetical protein F7725_021364 [Dissostichus mawsoni]